MKRTQFLDARRNIRKEIVAFVSIVMISLLAAVAFLGIAYSAATLRKDAVNFFNRTSLWDVEVTSTMLMTDDDLEAMRAVGNIGEAERVWQIDARIPTGDHNISTTVMNLPEKISTPVLVEGRLPESITECAIEKKLADDSGFSVGQRITLDCDPLMDVDPLAEHSFSITGIFYTPDHFSYMIPVTPYILVPESSFNHEGLNGAFMKARLRIEDAPENRYIGDYWNLINAATAELEALAEERAPLRSEDLRNDFEQQLRDGEEKIRAAKEQLLQSIEKIENGRQELEAAEKQLGDMKNLLDYTGYLLAKAQRMIESGTVEPEGELAWLNDRFSHYDLETLLRIAEKEFEKKRNDWYYSGEEYLDGLTRFQKGKKQLEEGEREIAEGEQKIEDAEKELSEARKKLDEIGACRWVVFNDNGNPGFVYAEGNADKLSSLSMSFSTIFLVVGALVIYATIARMVEQQRKLIGVNKALGLFSREIFAKYLFFACSAVMLGVGFGILLAYFPMQRAVLSSYEAHLNYGVGTRSFLPLETGIVAGGALSISVAAVYLGCARLLRMPALHLMQGTPASSRRKKRRASAKSSLYFRLILRNMATDRNRVVVTIVSIAGGCVLMVVGFTLRYGISAIPERQFNEILTYDAEIIYDSSANASVASEIEKCLDQTAVQFVNVHKESTVFEFDRTMNALTMIVAEKGELDGYYTLRGVDRPEEIDLPDRGSLIPRRFWEYYDAGIGDSVAVYDSGMNRREIPVSGIFENYYGQLFFLTPTGYEEIFGTAPECNCFFVKTGDLSLTDLQQMFNGLTGIVSINDARADRAMIEQFSSSLNFVVYLMLFIAGVMACFIVANFTMTFIQRKTGELTIMRINGFTSGECIRYLQLDLIVTTVLGTVAGLAFGGYMGARILRIAETPYIQAIRDPRIESFLFSALATFAFSAVTNGLALRRIRSLKLTDIS